MPLPTLQFRLASGQLPWGPRIEGATARRVITMLAAKQSCRVRPDDARLRHSDPGPRFIIFMMLTAAGVAALHTSGGAGNYSGVGRGNCMSRETTIEVEHCFREAGAGGSNPLTPTSISARLPANLGRSKSPETTERDANIHHRL